MTAEDVISDEVAIDHLRLDGMDSPDDRLDDMRRKRDQAVAIMADYMHLSLDDSPAPEFGDHVKAAMLLVLTGLWDGRDPGADLISPAVVALVARSRDPVFA